MKDEFFELVKDVNLTGIIDPKKVPEPKDVFNIDGNYKQVSGLVFDGPLTSHKTIIGNSCNANSELIFGETHYQTSAKFNKLQKRMWKKYFGIEIKDIKE